MIQVKKSDILRATLADDCGNTGFLGLAPDGAAYHVVVPVDAQIARGIKAGNRPDDQTPFGGYRGWHYFECLPYPADRPGGRALRAEENGRALASWAFGLGLEVVITKL